MSPRDSRQSQVPTTEDRVVLDASGRTVVPANIRKAGVESAVKRAQAQVRKALKGRKVSAVDQLIAERRAEARKEG